MVHVEGGTFRMGVTEEQGRDAWDNEKPVHRVTLSSYLIGKHEVTQALWEEVMGSNPSHNKQGGDYPVECVSWNDCQEFIEKLNARTGMMFRLPREAEWEYAARGGNRSKGYKYAGSNNLDDVGWYGDNSGRHTYPVGEKKPNELGLYDMSGNVLEWCQDWYGAYSSEAQTNPTGPQSRDFRVLRGGGSWYDARCCRVSDRNSFDPGDRDDSFGLRLVLSL
ncbi:MAG: formylglycine-generating enzyme family protein [Bacteroidetes bacterium]|uniref:Formylglycine-generating enzyme family protein n=1 Tax=Candidatus Pullibacteroides excrementavium TaxID=2840905 RepID=A0A9D9H051_9BACT|nr:formylglycine-generating enzyme family protein [Candidatus Pullibacteroides excrementavium]